MITAVTAHFGVAPLGQGTPSCLPEPTEHRGGVDHPRRLWWDAAPLQGYPPAPRTPEVGCEEEQSL